MKENKNIITCPSCGRKYLPGEIFIPKYLIGQPKHIVKDVYGEILSYDDANTYNVEYYKCDRCNTTFRVKANIRYDVDIDEKMDFSSTYKVKLKKSGMNLSED